MIRRHNLFMTKRLAAPAWMAVLTGSILVFAGASQSFGWGFFAHRWIHRHAILQLPMPLQAFYQTVADSVVEKSIDPDLRIKHDASERWHHYIDIDHYDDFPFNKLPRAYETAVATFSCDTLLAYGDAPWHIDRTLNDLTVAMRLKEKKTIVQLSADIGHYVADIHVPLHTTLNYDGQRSGQHGIHSRFEREMIERFQDRYEFVPGKVETIADATAAAFEIILNSYVWVDNILHADAKARAPIKKYETREDFDAPYYENLQAALGGMAEKQMNAAATRVAAFWYTAWVRAGKPQL